MSEVEIIEIVQDYINYIRFKENARYSINQWFMAIEDLLDLYNKEKEKNKRIKDGILYVGRKNGKSHELKMVLEEYISKDKIRERIKELEDLNSEFSQRVIKSKEVYLTEFVQNILRELLGDDTNE